jgi:hypothetical protein
LLILQFSYGPELKIKIFPVPMIPLYRTLDLIRQYQLRGDRGLRVDTRNVGSVMRFPLPLTVTRGHYLLIGNDRMNQRPVGALVDALLLTAQTSNIG